MNLALISPAPSNELLRRLCKRRGREILRLRLYSIYHELSRQIIR